MEDDGTNSTRIIQKIQHDWTIKARTSSAFQLFFLQISQNTDKESTSMS